MRLVVMVAMALVLHSKGLPVITGADLLEGFEGALRSPDAGAESRSAAGSELNVWCSHFGACHGPDGLHNLNTREARSNVYCVAVNACKDIKLNCGAAGCRLDCAGELACSNVRVSCVGSRMVIVSSSYECSATRTASALLNLQADSAVAASPFLPPIGPLTDAAKAFADAAAALANVRAVATLSPTNLWTEFACSGRCAENSVCPSLGPTPSGNCGCCTWDPAADRCYWAEGGSLIPVPIAVTPLGTRKSAECSAHSCAAFQAALCSFDGVPLGITAANCNASVAPLNGGRGTCTEVLLSGTTCQPVCNRGYAATGSSSCSDGVLTAAECQLRTTAAPSHVPTVAPTVAPTTASPTASPTATPAPTLMPVASSMPTPAPSQPMPTPAPIPALTSTPTPSPTTPPTTPSPSLPGATLSPTPTPTTATPSFVPTWLPTALTALLASADSSSSLESHFASSLRPIVIEGDELSFFLSLASDGEQPAFIAI